MMENTNTTQKTRKKSVYDLITEKIIEQLESGVAPWRKPWQAGSCSPMNYHSKRLYRGINYFLLNHFADPYFLTFKQVNDLGGKVKKGAKSQLVIFWLWKFYDEDGEEIRDEDRAVKKIPFPRYYRVFNAADIEGIDFQYAEIKIKKDNEKKAACEEIVRRQDGLKLEHNNRSSAYYHPVFDYINLPSIWQFDSSADYYATLFHELGHWTGHARRLNRFKKKEGGSRMVFGDQEYSKEELIAEMCSVFLCRQCQINLPPLTANAASYLQGWIQVLKGDSQLVIQAAAQAEKAARFLLGTP